MRAVETIKQLFKETHEERESLIIYKNQFNISELLSLLFPCFLSLKMIGYSVTFRLDLIILNTEQIWNS